MTSENKINHINGSGVNGSGGSLRRILKTVGGYEILLIALAANITEGVSKVFIAANGGKMLDYIIMLERGPAVSAIIRIIALTAVMAGGIIIKDAFLGIYLEKGMVRLRRKTAEAIGRAKMSWLDAKHSGELSARISNDLNALGGALRPVLIMGLSLVVQQIISLGYMFSVNWLLTLMFFAVVPLTTALQWIYSKSIKKYRAANQNAVGKLSSVIYDCFGSFETVKSLTLEKEMSEQFADAQKRQYDAAVKETRVIAALTPISALGSFLPQFLLVTVGGFMIIGGSLTIGQLTVFLALSGPATRMLSEMIELIAAVRRLGMNAERIVELWDAPRESAEGESSAPEAGNFIVSFENVTFKYGSGTDSANVLNGVSLNIAEGQFAAIVGESGCGKSTVLKLAVNLYEPDTGSVKILGRDTYGWNAQAMRSHIAYVTQDTFLYPGTLRENITGGSDNCLDNGLGNSGNCGNSDNSDSSAVSYVSEARIQEAVEVSQLSEFVRSQPMGLDTQVGERGVFLSGGQRQRISVARALCKEARLLLLDEATSSLDQGTEADMVRAITSLKNRPALLMITHKLANIRTADNIIVIKDGRVCEQGTHAELESLNGEYARLLERQKGDVAF